MKVNYIDHMGTDLSVVNAARVSFAKTSEWVDGDIKEDGQGLYIDRVLSEKDARLINYLARHNHWTPFGHTAITVHVKAPIFVARQLGKHQVGFVWNEVSRRYVKDEPEFYEPEVWRKAADNVKQGSSDEPVDNLGDFTNRKSPQYLAGIEASRALTLYRRMIEAGVCAEQARMVLPQSMYTEWYWTGNLYGFAQMYLARTDSHTQRETQEIARQIGEIIQPLFPVSWEALVK